jgi:hypothetical protein
MTINLGYLDRSSYFFIQVAFQLSSRGWVDPFQTRYFAENLGTPEIEPGTSGSLARNCDNWTIEAGFLFNHTDNNVSSNICGAHHYQVLCNLFFRGH